ncbi:MAG: hypothetical protein Q8922_09045 [Bacteroidota bacterium]|nr:hypothetical protein [Bacteroidota bacterium]MDP4234290.1 hypothetical protein [Bacteroidota bacterium]MDP4243225.1 hypothetical protein [Bacteroidota bacterium]MDP4288069.1 hypothetical protein [Bacteroidota bacterium]
MRRSFCDAEYTVFDNDQLKEAARLIMPLGKNDIILITGGNSQRCSTFGDALKAIDPELWDFDLPDTLFELIQQNG